MYVYLIAMVLTVLYFEWYERCRSTNCTGRLRFYVCPSKAGVGLKTANNNNRRPPQVATGHRSMHHRTGRITGRWKVSSLKAINSPQPDCDIVKVSSVTDGTAYTDDETAITGAAGTAVQTAGRF